MSDKKPFDPTKPVQTRDGRPARIICTDRKTRDLPDHSIVALIYYNGGESAMFFRPDGRSSSVGEQGSDLVNVPERKSKFVALYRSTRGVNPIGGYAPLGTLRGGEGYDDLDRCIRENSSLSEENVCNILEYVFEEGKLVDVKFHAGKGVLA